MKAAARSCSSSPLPGRHAGCGQKGPLVLPDAQHPRKKAKFPAAPKSRSRRRPAPAPERRPRRRLPPPSPALLRVRPPSPRRPRPPWVEFGAQPRSAIRHPVTRHRSFMTARKLLLVDGSSYLYRAFHALPPLTNSKGEPTGAVLGVLNMLNKLIKEEAPERVAVVFDAPGRTFRDDLFDQYKAHRTPMPDDLRAQLQPLLDAVAALGLPLLRVAGVEADDVIGTLAVQGAAAGFDVLISTGDKDMAQLVDPRITLVNTMSNTRLDRAGVKAKFDVFPEQIVDYLALVGDSSDNIPGITGVGPEDGGEVAQPVSERWTHLIAHAADISRQGRRESAQRAARARVVAQARDHRCGTDAGGGSGGARRRHAGSCGASRRCTGGSSCGRSPNRWMRSRRRTTGAATPATGAPVRGRPGRRTRRAAPRREAIRPCSRKSRWTAWIAKLDAAPLISFDTETDSLDYMQAAWWGCLSRSLRARRLTCRSAMTMPARRAARPRRGAGGAQAAARGSGPLAKLGHHLKFDAHILANHGIALPGQRYDSMLESYVLDSVATRHDMDSTAARYLGVEHHPIRGRRRQGREANRLQPGRCAARRRLCGGGRRRHAATASRDLAAARCRTAAEESVRDHRAAAGAGAVSHGARRRARRSRAAEERRARNSRRACSSCRRRLTRRPAARSTSTRRNSCRRSCSASWAFPSRARRPRASPPPPRTCSRNWRRRTQLPKLILEYRGIAKLKSTYTDKLPDQIDEHTGRIHTCYHQAVRGDRPAVLLRSEPAEHSDPHARGPAHPPGLRRAPRAIRWWPPTIRRSSCASWRTCRATRAC